MGGRQRGRKKGKSVRLVMNTSEEVIDYNA